MAGFFMPREKQMPKKKQTDMSAFFTRDSGNKGIELPLVLPNGKDSGHSLKIRSVDSDVFRQKDMEIKRDLAATAKEKDFDPEQWQKQKTTELIASLVISWTLKDEFTPENVIKFLSEAPQIEDQINEIAVKRTLFLAKR